MINGGRLYQIAVTPVYVHATEGQGLINVLVLGYAVDADAARQLKEATGGSDFVFTANGRVIASTLDRDFNRTTACLSSSRYGFADCHSGPH